MQQSQPMWARFPSAALRVGKIEFASCFLHDLEADWPPPHRVLIASSRYTGRVFRFPLTFTGPPPFARAIPGTTSAPTATAPRVTKPFRVRTFTPYLPPRPAEPRPRQRASPRGT